MTAQYVELNNADGHRPPLQLPVMERNTVLDSYRVLDLTDESGFSCGKILADLGADVVKVEPPQGDAARHVDHLYFVGYNTGKRGITLNLETARGLDLLHQLAARADFLIETFPPGTLKYQALHERNPRLIVISITPFGQSGPYRDYKSSDLITMAMGGLMSLIGEPGNVPLRVSLPQSPMWAGMYAAAGALVAHYYRETTNIGQHVDVSMQSSMLWAMAHAPAFWATNRVSPQRDGSRITGRSMTGARMRAIYECKDGYLNFIIYGGTAGRRSNQALVQWMAEHGLATERLLNKDWSRFSIQTSTQAEIDEIEEPAAKLFRLYRKSEFLEQAFKREIMGYPVMDAKDILNDPHLHDREFWRSLDSLKFPGLFARFSECPPPPALPAPRVGEHNAQIYGLELGLGEADIAQLRQEKVI
jgi:crotonobetainyl-CoA:carnitine CoA-transferase CaiB-like acyl-CoA transferase